MSTLKGKRTFIVNGIVAAIGLVTLILHLASITSIPTDASIGAIALALLNTYMRSITTTPPLQSQPVATLPTPVVVDTGGTAPH